jgi:phenylacetate-CoA ligase
MNTQAIERSLHGHLYLALQSLRGRPVGPALKKLQERERLDRASYQRLHEAALRETLRYALCMVPLYATDRWRQALAGADPERLLSWPILDRHTVKTHAAQLLARGRHPGLFYRNSSASTGEPLRVAWNPNGAGWGWANEYNAMMWHGLQPGARTLLMWGSGHALQDWVRNCKIFPTKQLTSERLEAAAQYLLREQPELCMGLPSALTLLARHVRANYPERFAADGSGSLVPFVKLGGEQVYPFQREELSRHLGAKVFESYGCTEVGPIAGECPAGSMHILSDNVHVEICRDGEPVAPGESGDIVVTSLVNRAMPLIRCRIGDSGRVSPDPCPCGRPLPVLQDLVGRAADVFLTADGRQVHGAAFGYALQSLLADAPVGAIRQVLFQQVDTRYWKALVESGDGFDMALAARLTNVVHATFGQECRVEIERTSVVPREPSGKFRYYRPLNSSNLTADPTTLRSMR